MTILNQYTALRHHFAEIARTQAVSLTYAHAIDPGTITRASGSFVTDGYEIGMALDVFGTTDNDARYEVGAVSALTLTLIAGQQFNSTETITSSLLGATYENDGMETWPIDLVRAAGFDDGFTPSVRPFSPFPVTLTVNGNITDAAAGASYTWYLSQGSDLVASQYFTMTHADSTRTGTVTLALTSVATAELGLASTTSAANVGQRARAMRYAYVYCQRQSDKAIQRANLLSLSDVQTV